MGAKRTISGTGPSIVELSGGLCLEAGELFLPKRSDRNGLHLRGSDGTVFASFTMYGASGSLSPPPETSRASSLFRQRQPTALAVRLQSPMGHSMGYQFLALIRWLMTFQVT